MHEVLFSQDIPLEDIYENHFKGMTTEEVPLNALLATRARLKQELPQALTRQHKDFLLSLVKLEPTWDLMPFSHLQDLPALKWKLVNLETLRAKKPDLFAQQYTLLAERIGKG